jgi:hypothetical protein
LVLGLPKIIKIQGLQSLSFSNKEKEFRKKEKLLFQDELFFPEDLK